MGAYVQGGRQTQNAEDSFDLTQSCQQGKEHSSIRRAGVASLKKETSKA